MAEAGSFVALQRLVDECRTGTLFDDYDEACTIVADAQVALRKLYEEVGRPTLPGSAQWEAECEEFGCHGEGG
jgi:hypothetical protein